MQGDAGHNWVLILAAGEGSRLRSLTTPATGISIPKQFCSLYDGPSLLHETLRRARAVAGYAHTSAIVAEQHRRFWEPQLSRLPAGNVIAQPMNRGTAIGILLPLLHILLREPAAQITLLPSDHHVRKEAVLAASLHDAVKQVRSRADATLLLGMRPEEADAELGYIVPGSSDGRGALLVERFVEKPPRARALELIRSGGLWNAFIVAACGQALLELFNRRIPEVVEAMRAAIRRDLGSAGDSRATRALYERLPIVDFSRDILSGQESQVRTLAVPACGWTDLGTPRRVAEALRRAPRPHVAQRVQASAFLSLAAEHERLTMEHAGRLNSPEKDSDAC